MAYDVKPAVDQALLYLEEMQPEEEEDVITNFLHKFSVRDEGSVISLVAKYPRAGHERRKLPNCEYIDIEIDDVKHIDNGLNTAIELRADAIAIIIPLIKKRFTSIVDNNLFNSMKWVNPQFWDEDNLAKNGHDKINLLIEEFKVPLESAGFEADKMFQGWKAAKSSSNLNISSFH